MVQSRVSNQAGFTLIEMMIAGLILTGGLLSIAVFSGSLVGKNANSERRTLATSFAEEKIEELRNKALRDDYTLTSADNSTDSLESGIFTRTWAVAGATAPKTITVSVSWAGAGNTNVTFTTMVND